MKSPPVGLPRADRNFLLRAAEELGVCSSRANLGGKKNTSEKAGAAFV